MRLALTFLHGLAVDVHRSTDVCVAHEFLLHFHRSSRFIKQSPKCVAERVPTDTSDTATNARGNKMMLLYSPWIPGCPAGPERACEYPVLGVFEERPALPIQEHFGQCRIERHSCIRVFGFDIAHYARNDASSHEERKVIPEHIAPLETE
jgi:hypothetical protein